MSIRSVNCDVSLKRLENVLSRKLILMPGFKSVKFTAGDEITIRHSDSILVITHSNRDEMVNVVEHKTKLFGGKSVLPIIIPIIESVESDNRREW